MNELTVLISSCDKYSDAWFPFFEFFKLYGGNLKKYNLVLASESKEYYDNELNISNIHFSKNGTWSKQISQVLKKIDSEYIFLLLEDFFLLREFDYFAFEQSINKMSSDKNIGYIALGCRDKNEKCTEVIFNEFVPNQDNKRVCIPVTLWRRDYFIKLLADHENIWDFERYSRLRACQYSEKLYRCDYGKAIFYYEHPSSAKDGTKLVGDGYGIVRGKWLKSNVELFDKYNINVNFEKLGWYEEGIQTNKSSIIKKIGEKNSLFKKIDNRVDKFKRRKAKKELNKLIAKSSIIK